jgi:hypothetical protein
MSEPPGSQAIDINIDKKLEQIQVPGDLLAALKGTSKNPTHNFADACNNINTLSRLVVLLYQQMGNMLVPLVAQPKGYFRQMSSYVHLHSENLITSLNYSVPTSMTEGPFATNHLRYLQDLAQSVMQELNLFARHEQDFVKIVKALIEASRARNKRKIDSVDSDSDGTDTPNKKAKTGT